MLLATDPDVIEQYERRKEEVCLLVYHVIGFALVAEIESIDQVVDQEN